ncbi:MAG: hypothetical protein GX657_13625, partial [Chloroflexi bacterium]|nr:hypothetical protein [Chloroflexota bacterium]
GSGTVATAYRYTGQWEAGGRGRPLSLGGIYHYRARWYDPTTGRFLQPDPLVPSYQNPQSLNRYSYVLGNPLRFTDPSGHYIHVEDALGPFGDFGVRRAGDGSLRVVQGGARFRNEYEKAFANHQLSGGQTPLPDLPSGAFGATVARSAANAIAEIEAGETEPSQAPAAGSARVLRALADPVVLLGMVQAVVRAVQLPLDSPTVYYGDNPDMIRSGEWEWRGSLDPRSGKGSYYNPQTDESLHPDLHSRWHAPHWDYVHPTRGAYRLYVDGTLEPKERQ